MAKPNHSMAIDIGCGTGRFTKLLLNYFNFVVGIDSDFCALKRIRQKNIKAALVCGELQNLPFCQETFDFALLLEVLEHIADDIKGLHEVKRILKPNSKLIMSVPYPPPPYPDRAHKREGYTKENIFKLLNNIGFTIISYKFCMFRLSRIVLKFAVKFISIFKFPPPIIPILKLEPYLKKISPFDIVIYACLGQSRYPALGRHIKK